MITLLLISLAAIFKAVADTLQHHFDTSVFSKLNQKFWNPVVSCNYVRFLPFTKYRPDAWHIANSIMIIAFIASVVLYRPILNHEVFDFTLYGLAFNMVFNLNYNHILLKRN